jgi:hypothetical protein
MSDEKFDKLFKWIDLIRWVLYGLVAGAVALAVWTTKVQMTINDLEKHLEEIESNSQIHRDALLLDKKDTEHRFTALEQWKTDVSKQIAP